MLLKTLLNFVTNYKSFRFGNVSFEQKGTPDQHIVAVIHPHKNSKVICSKCGKPSPKDGCGEVDGGRARTGADEEQVHFLEDPRELD